MRQTTRRGRGNGCSQAELQWRIALGQRGATAECGGLAPWWLGQSGRPQLAGAAVARKKRSGSFFRVGADAIGKKPRLWGSVAPRGRGQRMNPKNRVNFLIVTTCGMVRRFHPLRIVWHVAGRPGCGFEPRQRSRHCAPYIRSTARQKPGEPAGRTVCAGF